MFTFVPDYVCEVTLWRYPESNSNVYWNLIRLLSVFTNSCHNAVTAKMPLTAETLSLAKPLLIAKTKSVAKTRSISKTLSIVETPSVVTTPSIANTVATAKTPFCICCKTTKILKCRGQARGVWDCCWIAVIIIFGYVARLKCLLTHLIRRRQA